MPKQIPPQPSIPPIMSVAEFMDRFRSDEACHEHLRKARWGEKLERFECPVCHHRKGWWLVRRKLVECPDCHRRTSVLAGTLLQGTRTALWKWFRALYVLAHDKKGLAALERAKQAQLSYTTAWLMLQKLRVNMHKRDQLYLLQGLVEMDETYVGGEDRGHIGRYAEKKTPVAIAVELNEQGRPHRIALGALEKVTGKALTDFADRHFKPGTQVRSDGLRAYRALARAGYPHEAQTTGGGPAAVEKFPWLHTFISNLKRMILGTHHHVAPKYLDDYLAEFVYRANRRWREENIFERLVRAALGAKALTRRELVAGAN